MKAVIWIIVAIVIVGGLVWFFSTTPPDPTYPEDNNQQNNRDQLSADGRVLETDTDIFDEIDDAVGYLE